MAMARSAHSRRKQKEAGLQDLDGGDHLKKSEGLDLKSTEIERLRLKVNGVSTVKCTVSGCER